MIWTLKRQDLFSQVIQGPPELSRIAASRDRPEEAPGFPYWLRRGAKTPTAARKR
jgi:hypothetical protein